MRFIVLTNESHWAFLGLVRRKTNLTHEKNYFITDRICGWHHRL